MSFSERKSVICERNPEFEGSSIKRMRLDDDILRSLTKTVSSSFSSSSSLAYSVSDSGGFCSSEEDNHRRSNISSGCSSNELATNTRLPFLDLEAHQISETEISALITNNFRKQETPSTNMESSTTEIRDQLKPEKKTEKPPTKAELDDFFSTAERNEQKRFTEKYNYDIVNDTPLEGRYQWSLI